MLSIRVYLYHLKSGFIVLLNIVIPHVKKNSFPKKHPTQRSIFSHKNFKGMDRKRTKPYNSSAIATHGHDTCKY